VGKLNWKKILLFGTTSAFVPVLGQWTECMQAGGHCPFTAGTVLLPAIPSLVLVLTALFSNPRHSQ